MSTKTKKTKAPARQGRTTTKLAAVAATPAPSPPVMGPAFEALEHDPVWSALAHASDFLGTTALGMCELAATIEHGPAAGREDAARALVSTMATLAAVADHVASASDSARERVLAAAGQVRS